MSQSLSKVYVHITFSVKNRLALIDDSIREELFRVIGGICKSLQCNPVQIGGFTDHVHILCILSRNVTQAKLLEKIKHDSSLWIKTKGIRYAGFYWQNGYAVFSVKPTDTFAVVEYIRRQQEHHQKQSYKEEFLQFLKKYGVEFDERYVWD